MDILKYLDVLIGLTVVMILLSPLVSSLTQLWVWAWTIRAKRLEVALKQLILQLKVPYDRFEAVEVSVLANAAAVTLGGVTKNAGAAGTVKFENDIPGLLEKGNGTLTFDAPLPDGARQKYVARGPRAWQITSSVTDNAGVAKVKCVFPGPAQFASTSADVVLPPNTTLSGAKIASGPLVGTLLTIAAPAGQPTTVTYPPSAQPVPASHDLELTLTNAAGAAVPNVPITLQFKRTEAFDREPPLLNDKTARNMARAVLLHPMVGRPPVVRVKALEGVKWWERLRQWRMRGEVIEREELIRILLGFAANEGGGEGADAATREHVRRLLFDNGIADPARALASIRAESQRLEREKPDVAAGTRLATAILTAVPSEFVGKINNWFDQTMARTTAEYKFRTQIITVVGAFVVALAIQMDSLDLLRKLATDDKLRNSLVDQAKEQQKRIDELAKTSANDPNKNAVQDELQLARVRRDEIETNLTKLRDPSLAILPDHFIWQPVPQARLLRDSGGRRPESRRLELVVGAGTYVIEPPRSGDPLIDISNALRNSGAPVTTRIDRPHEIRIKTNDVGRIRLEVDGKNRLEPGKKAEDTLMEARLVGKAPSPGDVLYLAVGYDQYQIKIGKTRGIKVALETAEPVVGNDAEEKARKNAEKNAKPAVAFDDARQVLRATKPETRWLELLTKKDDFTTNLLGTPTDVTWVGSVAASALKDAKQCMLWIDKSAHPVVCQIAAIVKELRARGVDAQARDQLLLISRRNPPLQLRETPGRPETNLLESGLDWKCSGWRLFSIPRVTDVCFDYEMILQSWLGLLVTWMLLSLGAPFWYDALKDLLKLRSTLAKKEEKDRNQRAKTQT
ncbi:MAG TPA: hypothetical protein VK548_12035 [Candidatus Acidoferrum sp.]|nr:hypothetical protein [Candidatus Acidoferrum sp.]